MSKEREEKCKAKGQKKKKKKGVGVENGGRRKSRLMKTGRLQDGKINQRSDTNWK